jgi:hypothetical protein
LEAGLGDEGQEVWDERAGVGDAEAKRRVGGVQPHERPAGTGCEVADRGADASGREAAQRCPQAVGAGCRLDSDVELSWLSICGV